MSDTTPVDRSFEELRDHIEWLKQQENLPLPPADQRPYLATVRQARAVHEQVYQQRAEADPNGHFEAILPELRERTYYRLDDGFLWGAYDWHFGDDERHARYRHLLEAGNHAWLINTVKQKAYNLRKDAQRPQTRWEARNEIVDLDPPARIDGGGGEGTLDEALDRAVESHSQRPSTTNPEELYLEDEAAASIQTLWQLALDQLTPLQRKVYELKVKGYTPAEIASRLNISKEAVYKHVQRGAHAILEYLADELEAATLEEALDYVATHYPEGIYDIAGV